MLTLALIFDLSSVLELATYVQSQVYFLLTYPIVM